MSVPTTLVEAVSDCTRMIDTSTVLGGSREFDNAAEPLPSLLEQCEQLTDLSVSVPEPIHTIHHFACTGGTLIAKCLSCMPNTQLLSEVEPFSRMQSGGAKGFHPTDLIQLLRRGSRGTDPAIEGQIFLAGLQVLHADCQSKGLRLVLRDHTHSRYCVGDAPTTTPGLRRLVADIIPVRAVVTVRHPLDSFLSAEKRGWLHFEPSTLDEYCNRYLRFLDDYDDVPLFKYEDFVAAPETELQAICEALGLPFAAGFELLFGIHSLSGDSGRTGDLIAPRVQRAVLEAIASQAAVSTPYEVLCQRLKYELRR